MFVVLCCVVFVLCCVVCYLVVDLIALSLFLFLKVLYVAEESTRSQLKRQRIHPSVFTFLYASDELPPQHVERGYLKVFTEERWPTTYLNSAADRTSKITGPSGVKMSGIVHTLLFSVF
jgi:hypothetical protein